MRQIDGDGQTPGANCSSEIPRLGDVLDQHGNIPASSGTVSQRYVTILDSHIAEVCSWSLSVPTENVDEVGIALGNWFMDLREARAKAEAEAQREEQAKATDRV